MSEVETTIIDILRESKPYEKIEITKDPSGKIDSYMIVRTQKIVLNSK